MIGQRAGKLGEVELVQHDLLACVVFFVLAHYTMIIGNCKYILYRIFGTLRAAPEAT